MNRARVAKSFLLFLSLSVAGWRLSGGEAESPRMTLFIGVDISKSFQQSPHFDDSLDFLAHYIYAHLNGLGGLEVPKNLFVGSIGGATVNEPKTFYPRQTFENQSVEEIAVKLKEMFPKSVSNPFTDFNAFFEQIGATVRNKNLILRPTNIVMVSDGIPDVGGAKTYNKVNLKPLENLARNVTVRLIYTDAVVGADWQNKVKRRRVKVWTQDAVVMTYWRDPKIFEPNKPFDQQTKVFAWIKDNVDFGVRAKRVD